MLHADPHHALDALADLDRRQRLLRGAYGTARYGWPEGPACAWARRPATFDDLEPGCRVTEILDGWHR